MLQGGFEYTVESPPGKRKYLQHRGGKKRGMWRRGHLKMFRGGIECTRLKSDPRRPRMYRVGT